MAEYVSDRVPDLDAVGTQKNTLYYGSDDVKVSEVQYDTLQGKFRQTLSSLQFGGISEINIPNSDSVSSCYLYMKLPNLLANQTLCDYWGYGIIKNVSYTIGGSNISIIDLPGESIFQRTLLSCESKEKRSKLREIGGTALSGANTTPEAIVQIPLPWSTIRSCKEKLSYDASLLSTNILIQITFNEASAIYGSGAAGTVFPSALLAGDVYIKQDVLTNKRDSMKLTLMKNPNLLINYPMVHSTRGSTRNLVGDITANTFTIDLNSFLESDLLGISFHTVLASDEAGAPTAGSVSNKFKTLRLRDIVLKYNGQILHNLTYHLHDLMLLGMDIGDPDYNVASIDAGGVIGPQTTGHIYYLPMTRFKSVVFEGMYHNTSRFANQTFQLEFTMDTDFTASTPFNFYSTYYYNAVVSTSNGMSNIQFA